MGQPFKATHEIYKSDERIEVMAEAFGDPLEMAFWTRAEWDAEPQSEDGPENFGAWSVEGGQLLYKGLAADPYRWRVLCDCRAGIMISTTSVVVAPEFDRAFFELMACKRCRQLASNEEAAHAVSALLEILNAEMARGGGGPPEAAERLSRLVLGQMPEVTS